MQPALAWLSANHDALVRQLADLVAVPSISTDGQHQPQVEQTATLTCEQMRQAGLQNVEVLRSGNSNPYAYGEWLGAPGKPTVFLYAHHDVQPVNFADQWLSDPWTLTPREGRLFGRGAVDDKGAITAQLGAVAAYLKNGGLPVNIKMLVEGEEEVGSTNLIQFFDQYRDRIRSDVIVVCDSGNLEVGTPSITYSLRGVVAVLVEVEGLKGPVHSGSGGGILPDAAMALDYILARLYPKNGKYPVPGLYDKVRKPTAQERRTYKKLPGDDATWRHEFGMLAGVQFATPRNTTPHEATWRWPAITIIAQEASSIRSASNQVLPKAQAIVSCRIVPDQDPDEVVQQVTAVLTKDPPWGVRVTVQPQGAAKWWMTEPTGPAFEAALDALKAGYGKKALAIGCGGSIGFVGPLAGLFGGAPALLLGIEDPLSNAHAPNESLHEGDWRKLMASLVHLFKNVADLPEGRVKAAPPTAAAEERPRRDATGSGKPDGRRAQHGAEQGRQRRRVGRAVG
jgi:acetylornithine deacetylase/succinyl-diaminopimelate desuccinylase-like protein